MNKKLVQQQFGAHAEAYATSRVHAKGASLQRLVELLQPQPEWQVLDVATAAGHTAIVLAPHVGHVVATDITPEMLPVAAQQAQEKCVHNISFEEADAEALPFADQRFDLVTCRIAPHHFPDIGRFVAESVRVLRPGGILAVVDNVAPDSHTSSAHPAAALADAADYYNRFEKLRDPSHGRAWTLEEWIALFGAVGLAEIHYEIAPKEMAFDPWVKRLGASAQTQQEVRALLVNAPPAAKEYLQPALREQELWFRLAEAIVIGKKGMA